MSPRFTAWFTGIAAFGLMLFALVAWLGGSPPIPAARAQVPVVQMYPGVNNATGAGVTEYAPAVRPQANASAGASLVLKASPGTFFYGQAANTTATAGFCLLIDATSAPNSGASVTPLAFAALPASGTCVLGSGVPMSFLTGIVFLVSSNSSPFTFTSGTITAGIYGLAQ